MDLAMLSLNGGFTFTGKHRMTYYRPWEMAFHEADQLWRGTIIAANVNEVGAWAERITPAHIITRQRTGRPPPISPRIAEGGPSAPAGPPLFVAVFWRQFAG